MPRYRSSGPHFKYRAGEKDVGTAPARTQIDHIDFVRPCGLTAEDSEEDENNRVLKDEGMRKNENK